jgi:porphobilinogen deaminase
MTFKIRIATRRSKLALRQVEIVKSFFGQEVQTDIVEVITSADKILDKSLSDYRWKRPFYQGIRKLYIKR